MGERAPLTLEKRRAHPFDTSNHGWACPFKALAIGEPTHLRHQKRGSLTVVLILSTGTAWSRRTSLAWMLLLETLIHSLSGNEWCHFGGGVVSGLCMWRHVHIFLENSSSLVFFMPSQPVQLHQSEFAEKVTLTCTLTLHSCDACGMSYIHSLQANMKKCISRDQYCVIELKSRERLWKQWSWMDQVGGNN